MNAMDSKRRKTKSGKAGAKRSEKSTAGTEKSESKQSGTSGAGTEQSRAARPRNTVSRIDSSTHQNTPKTASPAVSEEADSELQGGNESQSAGGSSSGRLSDLPKEEGSGRLRGLQVAILVTDGFEIAELVEPREALEEAGAETTVIAPKTGEVQGFNHDEKGKTVSADADLSSANAEDFDAVLLPGGALNADALRVNEDAQKFVQEMDGAGKPIAVICHAPWLLISAGLTKGRKMTSYHTIQDDVRSSGATWEDQEVIRERNWVSSRQPRDIPAFNREMISLFAEGKGKAKTAAGR